MLFPPIAFLVYLLLVGLLYGLGQRLAGRGQPTTLKTSIYTGGEAPPATKAAPGYRPYFVIALFFAVLHLGALVLGTTSGMPGPPIAALYLAGLLLVLLALILG
jgi:NADH:ubiquinone oxidoreductase subunit 3 (subunit A)